MKQDNDKALVEEMLIALREGADFRRAKVRRLRAAIRAKAYENRLKLEIASDRLAADLLSTSPVSADSRQMPSPTPAV